MKKSIKLIALFVAITFATNTFASELGIKMSNLNFLSPAKSSVGENSDKAFAGKGSKTLSIGFGASSFNSIYPNKNDVNKPDGWYSPIAGTITIQAEFGIHKYVGIGVVAGVGGSRSLSGFGGLFRRSYYGIYNYGSDYFGIYVPVGIVANFHFYQLIEDKTSKDIHGDKLDLYAGANLGSGLSVAIPKKNAYSGAKSALGALIWGGVQFGVKYYPKSNVGIFAEVGYGKNIVNAGVCFKM